MRFHARFTMDFLHSFQSFAAPLALLISFCFSFTQSITIQCYFVSKKEHHQQRIHRDTIVSLESILLQVQHILGRKRLNQEHQNTAPNFGGYSSRFGVTRNKTRPLIFRTETQAHSLHTNIFSSIINLAQPHKYHTIPAIVP